MKYLEWNDNIARYFFNEEKSGREVLLYVNNEIITKLGEKPGDDVNDFINAVKEGPPWVSRRSICQKALQTYENWRFRSLDYPPYIAYLAFFVLAGGSEGPFAPHAYYPRFWKLLQEPEHSKQPPSFDKMIILWKDLEEWSTKDKHEELGRFVARTRGSWWMVGLPLSQTLLSDEERNHLPNLFNKANLDPTDSPSPEIVPRILHEYGQGILERRTLRLLETGEEILKKALVSLVLDELEEWDGSVIEDYEEKGIRKSQVRSSLRICLNIDNVSRTVRSYLRFKTGRIFPEEGLHFEGENGINSWSCRELSQGWSTKLKDENLNPPADLDASEIDWREGIELVDKENNWHAKLPCASTRLFVPGKHEGLPDLIETRRLERSTEFLVACKDSDIEKVSQWGTENCEYFEKRDYSGLPPGWVIYYGRNAIKSCENIDVLSLSTTLRLLLRGGIKTGRGNRYLAFAPPRIVLENITGSEKVTVNGKKIMKLHDRPVWLLPDDSPTGETLHIEVKNENTELRRHIRLEDPIIPHSHSDLPCRDKRGELSNKDRSPHGVSGVFIENGKRFKPIPDYFPTHLSSRIIFIGERPGEIAYLPRENLPREWKPVWAIAKKGRKKWKAYFCGTPKNLNPDFTLVEPVQDDADLKRWKEAIWRNRKIIKVRDFKPELRAWRSYLEAARNV